MMIREIASIIARDFGALTVVVQASEIASDWLLASELIAAGAQQVDLLVDNPEHGNQHLERGHLDSRAIRLIFASYLGLSSTNWVGEQGAFVIRRFHHFPDPAEFLVRARDLGVKLLCVETAWIEPFSYSDSMAFSPFKTATVCSLLASRQRKTGRFAAISRVEELTSNWSWTEVHKRSWRDLGSMTCGCGS